MRLDRKDIIISGVLIILAMMSVFTIGYIAMIVLYWLWEVLA